MDNESPAFWNSRPAQYSIPLLAIAVVVLMSWGDQPSLVFIKAAACPLFFLASRGLHLIFTPEAPRRRWTLVFIEYRLLDALVFSCWLAIVLWTPDQSLTQVVTGFFVAFAVYGAFMLFGRLAR